MGEGGKEAGDGENRLISVEEENLIQEKEKQRESGVIPPPDGGWGWVVVAAGFMCNMVLDGIGYSFGILLGPLIDHYKVGKGVMSMVGSVLAGVILLTGPLAAALINKFGTRLVCMAGAVTACVAIFLSTYSPNVPVLMFVYGILGGGGLGLMYVPAVTAVGYWFEKRRALVTGISVCGTGFGTFVFAPLTVFLERELGWQGTNKIMGGICLLCVIFGAAMKPVTAASAKKKDVELDSIDLEKEKNKEKPIYKDPLANEDLAFIDGSSEKSEMVKKETAKVEEKVKNEGSSTIQAYKKLMKNVPFLLIMLGNLPAVMGLYIPYVFLPSMAKERSLTAEEASFLISLVGIFQTAGRIISGAIADHPKMDPLAMTCVSLAVGATCPFIMIFCYSYPAFIAVAILFGLSLSAWVAVSSPMLVNLLGLELLTTAFGVLTCIRGAAAFLGPPVAGFAVDATVDPSIENDAGDYTVAFWISTCLLGVSAVVHCVAWCARRSHRTREAAQQADQIVS